ncbi:methyl-accepting chemotaxis protein [Aliikangiella sp. IMCC44359]|uniref:methyl-accepting chemotaxis protein n=1 Tax=Aliikangiella sp. IMCC44359 TaxID=3459125 RepID=UPI00403AAD01
MSFVRRRSISRRLVAASAGSVLFLLVIFAFFAVDFVSNQTREQIEESLESMISAEGLKIVNFFAEKQQLNKTIFSSPQLIEWFANHDVRQEPLGEDKNYDQIIAHFKHLTDTHPTIKSVYFASAITGEYFLETGRREDKEYWATKRPWWSEALQINKGYVGSASVDIFDGAIISAVQHLVRDKSGKLIGIAGVDVLITTIGADVLNKIKYQGQGEAFLISNEGKIVFFPDISVKQIGDGTKLEAIDQLQSSENFKTLQQRMLTEAIGVQTVSWKGVEHRVIFQDVSMKEPVLNWHLGFMLPTQVIEEPIKKVSMMTWLSVLGTSLVLAVIIYFETSTVLKPLNNLVDAMKNVAHGEGDLTQRIRIQREDEVGELAQEFNYFVEQIQEVVRQAAETTEQVNDVASEITDMSFSTQQRVSQQLSEVELVATAVTEMVHTVEGISSGAEQTSQSADQADEQVQSGQNVVEAATGKIGELSDGVLQASEVVGKLRADSDSINEVLEVIKSIAEQTNLLALNAAIEAARAGEQGRGFAVVADEVRTLASRTQDSTENIQHIIESLQESALRAESVMTSSRDLAKDGVEQTEQVKVELSGITASVANIRLQAEEIALATSQQVTVASDISEKVEHIHSGAKDNNESVELMSARAGQLSEQATKLKQVVSRFKV